MTYPYVIPVNASKLLEGLLSTLGAYPFLGLAEGYTYQLVVRSKAGAVLFQSPVVRNYKELPAVIRYRPEWRDLSIRVYIIVRFHEGPRKRKLHQVYARLPYTHLRKQKVLKIWWSIPETQDTVRKTRIRAYRLMKRRKEWTRRSFPKPAKQPRINPTERFAPMTYLNMYGNYNYYPNTPRKLYMSYYKNVYWGATTPGYLDLKRRKALPVNDYAVYVYWRDDGGFYSEVVNHDSPSNSSILIDSYTAFLGASSTGRAPLGAPHNVDTQDRAVSKLIRNAGFGINNVAQDLLQFGQTTNMIMNTCNRITRSVTALRGGNVTGAISALWDAKTPHFRKGKRKALLRQQGKTPTGAALANNWLELQYGWKPLLQDIVGSMEALARYHMREPSRISTVTSSATDTLNEVIRFDMGDPDKTKCGVQICILTTTVKFGVRYRVSEPLKAYLAQTGFTNPLNLAWEVIPFSFVVDWFLPIGPYLESLTAFDGVEFVDGFKTRFTKEENFWDSYFQGRVPSDPTNITRFNIGTMTQRGFRHNREKLYEFPSLTPPRFKNPFTVTHVLNAMALMRQVFRK